jgi:hypothetical protein
VLLKSGVAVGTPVEGDEEVSPQEGGRGDLEARLGQTGEIDNLIVS